VEASFLRPAGRSLTPSCALPHVATEIEGTFRVNGSNKRMRELQAVFETPPRVRIPLSPTRLCCRRVILVWQVARLEKGELRDARRCECLPSISYPFTCAWSDACARPTLFHCVAEVCL
jgi:hypothetical protein